MIPKKAHQNFCPHSGLLTTDILPLSSHSSKHLVSGNVSIMHNFVALLVLVFFVSHKCRGQIYPHPLAIGGNGWEVPKLSWNLLPYRNWCLMKVRQIGSTFLVPGKTVTFLWVNIVNQNFNIFSIGAAIGEGCVCISAGNDRIIQQPPESFRFF